MIRLRDSITIHVPPEQIWTWLNELPAHYLQWHPAHVRCRYDHGDRLEPGAVLYVEEVLHGRLHRLRLRATQVVPERALHYRGPGFKGAFLLAPADGSTSFTAELSFGTPLPILSAILDPLLRLVLGRRLTEFESHMHEEGLNLKRLLEREHAA